MICADLYSICICKIYFLQQVERKKSEFDHLNFIAYRSAFWDYPNDGTLTC